MTILEPPRTTELPIEIVIWISRYCALSTLRSLALASSGLSKLITPLLYSHVEINDLDTLTRLSNTLIHESPHLGDLIVSLSFDTSKKYFGHKDKEMTIVSQILSRTPNLQDLTLLFNDHLLLSMLDPAENTFLFSLTSFTCTFSESAILARFLDSQPSIKSLNFPRETRSLVVAPRSLPFLHKDSLPLLSSLSSEAYVALELVPGRPIRDLKIGIALGMDILLPEALSKSACPLDVLEISIWANMPPDFHNPLFEELYKHSVQPKKLSLKVLQPLEEKKQVNQPIMQDARLLKLGGFLRLETFEMLFSEGPASSNKDEESTEAERATFWAIKDQCSSLQVLTLFGRELRQPPRPLDSLEEFGPETPICDIILKMGPRAGIEFLVKQGRLNC